MTTALLISAIVAILLIIFIVVRSSNRQQQPQLLTGERNKDLARLRPRLVTAEFLKQAQEHLRQELPHTSFYATGLNVAYVLDNPEAVAYVTKDIVTQLRLTEMALYEIAVSNLKKTFSQDNIKKLVTNKGINVIKLGDGHDASRLILLPGCLAEGEEIAVTIPDVDTLSICPVPEDWASLRECAMAADSRPLLDKPLLVTKGNVKVMN